MTIRLYLDEDTAEEMRNRSTDVSLTTNTNCVMLQA
jgi:hypothetical protein